MDTSDDTRRTMEPQILSSPSSPLTQYLARRTPEVLQRCGSQSLENSRFPAEGEVENNDSEYPQSERIEMGVLELEEKAPLLSLMSRAERRRAERMPKPTKTELQQVEVLSSKLASISDFSINPTLLETGPKSKLHLATRPRKPRPPRTGSALYDKLLRAGIQEKNSEKPQPNDDSSSPKRKRETQRRPRSHHCARRFESTLTREITDKRSPPLSPVDQALLSTAEYLASELENVEDLPVAVREVRRQKRRADGAARLWIVLTSKTRTIQKKCVDEWHTTAMRVTKVRITRANCVLGRAFMRYAALRESQQRAKQIRAQSMREKRTIEQRIAARVYASIILQSLFRAHAARMRASHRRLLSIAAIKTQQYCRSKQAKSRIIVLRRERHRRIQATVKIQSSHRGHLGRRRFRAAAAARRAEKLTELIQKRIEKRRAAMRLDGAALAIQARCRKRKQYRVDRIHRHLFKIRQQHILFRAITKFLQRSRKRRARELVDRRRKSALFIATWTQKHTRRKQAVRIVHHLHFNAKVEAALRRKLRARKLAQLNHDRIYSNYSITAHALASYFAARRAYRRYHVHAADRFGLPRSVCKFMPTKLAATKIQAVYRGHRVRLRIELMKIKTRFRHKHIHARRRINAAILIQSHIRAFIAHNQFVKVQLYKYAVMIQTAYRGLLGRRRAKHTLTIRASATKVQSIIRSSLLIRHCRLQVVRRRLLRKPVSTIQALARGVAARSYILNSIAHRRIAAEEEEMALAMMKMYRRVTCAELAAESYTSASEEHAGEFQAVFARHCRLQPPKPLSKHDAIKQRALDSLTSENASKSSTATRPSVLIARKMTRHKIPWYEQQDARHARMTSNEFVKLFKETPGCVVGGKPVVAKQGRIQSKPFKSNDLELIFAREKSVGEKTITFEQFMAALDLVCAELRAHVKIWEKGVVARGRKSRALSMLFDGWLLTPWAARIKKTLSQRVDALLSYAATVIQLKFRAIRATRLTMEQRIEREQSNIKGNQEVATRRIQARVRGIQARALTAILAKDAYIKYVVDSDELAEYTHEFTTEDNAKPVLYYWAFKKLTQSSKIQRNHSKESSHVSWTKPRLLGDGDVERVTARPNNKTAFIVDCAHCQNAPARRVCLGSCCDAFCESCFLAVHRRGNRRNHKFKQISTCVDCGDSQPASRICSTCSAKEGRLATLCDVCFANRHGFVNDAQYIEESRTKATLLQQRIQLEKEAESKSMKAASKAARTETLEDEKEALHQVESHRANIVKLRAQLRAVRIHKWTPLVLPCEHCGHYAARWRCQQCEQCTCADCYGKLHSRGARLSHTCQRLSYYAPEIQARVERLYQKPRRSQAAHVDVKSEQACFGRAAVKIQAAYWRMIDRRRGLKIMKARRQALRAAWRHRVADEAQRKLLSYKLLDAIGCAPILPSDTRRDRILKRIARWKRKRAEYYITQNVDADIWYPNRPEAIKNRKKRPKRGFEVGTASELRVQALHGGVLLPAKASPVGGSRQVMVSSNLHGILRPGDRLIIDKKVVWVDCQKNAVTETSVQLRFCWLGTRSLEDPPLPMYRLPPQSTGGRLLTKTKQSAYENLFTQTLLVEPLVSIAAAFARTEKRVAKKFRNSLPRQANSLKRQSRRHEQLAEHLLWRTVTYQKKSSGRGTDDADLNGSLNELLGGKKARQKKTFKDALPTPTTHADYEESKRQARETAYLEQSNEDSGDWIEFTDEKTGKAAWRSKITEEITFEKPLELKSQAEIAFDAKKKARLLRSHRA